MLYSSPNQELSREIIIQNFYARLSHNDQTMLDSSTNSFMKKTIEFKWDLLERIKRNSEDQELGKGKESGIKLEFDCVKSFMDTDAFHKFSTKYGLDSEIVASFCESFATHVDLPKEKWFKYHPPVKEKIEEPITLVPTAYIEKPPFPVRIKEHAKFSTVVNKSYVRTKLLNRGHKLSNHGAIVFWEPPREAVAEKTRSAANHGIARETERFGFSIAVVSRDGTKD